MASNNPTVTIFRNLQCITTIVDKNSVDAFQYRYKRKIQGRQKTLGDSVTISNYPSDLPSFTQFIFDEKKRYENGEKNLLFKAYKRYNKRHNKNYKQALDEFEDTYHKLILQVISFSHFFFFFLSGFFAILNFLIFWILQKLGKCDGTCKISKAN